MILAAVHITGGGAMGIVTLIGIAAWLLCPAPSPDDWDDGR